MPYDPEVGFVDVETLVGVRVASWYSNSQTFEDGTGTKTTTGEGSYAKDVDGNQTYNGYTIDYLGNEVSRRTEIVGDGGGNWSTFETFISAGVTLTDSSSESLAPNTWGYGQDVLVQPPTPIGFLFRYCNGEYMEGHESERITEFCDLDHWERDQSVGVDPATMGAEPPRFTFETVEVGTFDGTPWFAEKWQVMVNPLEYVNHGGKNIVWLVNDYYPGANRIEDIGQSYDAGIIELVETNYGRATVLNLGLVGDYTEVTITNPNGDVLVGYEELSYTYKGETVTTIESDRFTYDASTWGVETFSLGVSSSAEFTGFMGYDPIGEAGPNAAGSKDVTLNGYLVEGVPEVGTWTNARAWVVYSQTVWDGAGYCGFFGDTAALYEGTATEWELNESYGGSVGEIGTDRPVLGSYGPNVEGRVARDCRRYPRWAREGEVDGLATDRWAWLVENTTTSENPDDGDTVTLTVVNTLWYLLEGSATVASRLGFTVRTLFPSGMADAGNTFCVGDAGGTLYVERGYLGFTIGTVVADAQVYDGKVQSFPVPAFGGGRVVGSELVYGGLGGAWPPNYLVQNDEGGVLAEDLVEWVFCGFEEDLG